MLGERIDLTIDERLQKKAYELLGEESGGVILIDVHTGEILALASTPSYDPNRLTQGVSTQEWRELSGNERRPLTNKVVSEHYSPGSTFKMVVALAALEAGIIRPETRFFCAGKMFLGDHAFHCWKHSGHGYLDVVQALQHSCDIYFYETAQKVGIEKIAEMARRLGLGKQVGIGIAQESPGLIPDKAWKKRRFRGARGVWQQGETLISGIGQGYVLTTPLQLVTMMARLVNGGYEVKPTFTKVDEKERVQMDKIKISSAYLDLVKEGMFSVVNIPGGTAYGSRFNYNGQMMGGKTGTTQVKRITMKERQSGIIKDKDLPWHLRSHALFVGYAPHDNPKYAVAVLVEHGGGGSSVAAPIASKLLLEAVKLDPTKRTVD